MTLVNTDTVKIQRTKEYITWEAIQPKLQHGKLNQVLAPAGSGKTFMINQLAKQLVTSGSTPSELCVLHPYRVSKAEYTAQGGAESTGAAVKYFAKTIHEIIIHTEEDTFESSGAYLARVAQLTKMYVEAQGWKYILLDEGDFFMIQAMANKSGVTYATNNNDHTKLPMYKVAMTVLMSLLDAAQLVVSLSANSFKFPSDLVHIPNYEHSHVNTIVVDLTPNTTVNSFTVINTNDVHAGTVTSIKRLLVKKYVNTPTLVFSSKFTKPELKGLMSNNIHIVTRDSNTDHHRNEHGYSESILARYDNCIAIGAKDDSDLLTDGMIRTHQSVAINTSSSRSLSLTDDYGIATIIIFANSWSATTAQVCARFRNTPVNVIWVTNNPQSLWYDNTDPYKWAWLPEPVVAIKPMQFFGLTKGKANQATVAKMTELLTWLATYDMGSMRQAHKDYKVANPKGYGYSAFIKHVKGTK